MTDDMRAERSVQRKTEYIIALGLCLCVFFLGFFNLDNNCNWGDDFAAYMADGIAIAEGRYEEQTRINLLQREGPEPQTGYDSHVHAFGFPLLHALTYKLFGYDRVNFSNLWVYKLPSLIAFSLMAGIFYLFLRRRMGRRSALFGAAFLCLPISFYYDIRNLYNDCFFMALSLSSFYTAELFFESAGKRRHLWGLVLGLLLWAAYSTRLNGILPIAMVILGHVIVLLRDKSRLRREDLIPYLVFAALFLVFNKVIFPWPTSTSSLRSSFSYGSLVTGISYYLNQLYNWTYGVFESIVFVPLSTLSYRLLPGSDLSAAFILLTKICTLAFFALALIGCITELKRDIHIIVFIFISFVGTAVLNLGQELRYLYSILPHIIMLALCAAGRISAALFKGISYSKRAEKAGNSALWLISFAILLFMALPTIRADLENLRVGGREPLTAYSDDAVEMYSYINEHTDEDDIIAFWKNRALYLNTGRLSFIPGRRGYDVLEADWYLYFKPYEESEAFALTEEVLSAFEPIYENDEFALYRKTD